MSSFSIFVYASFIQVYLLAYNKKIMRSISIEIGSEMLFNSSGTSTFKNIVTMNA